MKCKAIQIRRPYSFSFGDVDIGSPTPEESIVDVHYSSVCGTDYQIYTGELTYYQTGLAQYPIITGHEWCGTCEGQPVVGICILGCGDCESCNKLHPIWCQSRQEVGVVNRNGAHAERLIVPTDSLLPTPEASPKYALVEPLAVAIHGLKRIDLKGKTILISGFGSIGKLCGEVLNHWGHPFQIYDPSYSHGDPAKTDVVIECSGNPTSLHRYYLERRGIEMLLFGFEYNPIEPGTLVSNEINLITSLGSDRQDFVEAIDLMQKIDFGIWSPRYGMFELAPFREFSGYEYHKKTVFDNKDI